MPNLTVECLLTEVAQLEPNLLTTLVRNNSAVFVRFNTLADAADEDWCFFNEDKYSKHLPSCKASGIVLSATHWAMYEPIINCPNVVVCSHPYAFFALATQVVDKHNKNKQDGCLSNQLHPTAIIHPTAKIGRSVYIGPWVTIGAQVVIGDNAIVHAHCTLGDHVFIGSDTLLYSHVSVYQAVQIGKQCIVHSGTVIGSDGFGFAPYQKRWLKIAHSGTVIIGDSVEIGANCTVDRGNLENTVIGNGTKLDNLIQIAHNVKVGENCAFASGVGIAGSAVIGNRVQIGGKAGVLGHLQICDDAVISSFTLVTKTIKKPAFYTGVYPIQENSEWEKNAVTLKKLFNLREQVKHLHTVLEDK